MAKILPILWLATPSARYPLNLSHLTFILGRRARLQPESVEDEYCTSESEIEYPLTPPLSDDAGSRPSSRQSDVREIPPKLHVTTLQLLQTDNWTELSRTRRRSGSKGLTRRHSYSVFISPQMYESR